jgi:hypothetical protein
MAFQAYFRLWKAGLCAGLGSRVTESTIHDPVYLVIEGEGLFNTRAG